MKTMADRISDRFGNDTLQWCDDEGKHMLGALLEAGAREERFGWFRRFVLPDRSTVVVTPWGWYRSYTDCLCQANLGHSEHCPYGGTSQ